MSTNEKTTLIVGGGFLGKYIIDDMMRSDTEYNKIIVVDVIPKEVFMEHPMIVDYANDDRITYEETSALDSIKLKKYFDEGVDGIIYTAAIADVPVAEKNVLHTININVLHLASFMESLRLFDYQNGMVLMSSESVYGRQPHEKLHITDETVKIKNANGIIEERTISNASGLKEDEALTRPVSLYGATKLSQESIANAASEKYGIPLLILRSATMYGVYGRPKQVIPTFCRQILEQKKASLMGDGTSTSRDFAFVTDQVAAINVGLSKVKELNQEIINIGSGKETFLLNLINAIKVLANQKSDPSDKLRKYPYIPVDRKPFRAGEKGMRMVLDISKAKEKLGWEPAIDLVKGLNTVLRWVNQFANTDARYKEEMDGYLQSLSVGAGLSRRAQPPLSLENTPSTG